MIHPYRQACWSAWWPEDNAQPPTNLRSRDATTSCTGVVASIKPPSGELGWPSTPPTATSPNNVRRWGLRNPTCLSGITWPSLSACCEVQIQMQGAYQIMSARR